MPRLPAVRRPARAAHARRVALAVILSMLAPASFAADAPAPAMLKPTPAQTEGPFYPVSIPADHDADLTQIVGHAGRAQGTVLHFSGRVLARDGRPLPGVAVELWQCDALGRYHHVRGESGPQDDDFQGYGVATTDSAGRYAFTTIRPVAYPGRPPHLHVKLRNAAGVLLTTQIYIQGDRTDGDMVLGSSPRGTRELLSMSVAPAAGKEAGALAGAFDFVVQ
jgi:protocatechuate 3,4-dioxygenase beta subunit